MVYKSVDRGQLWSTLVFYNNLFFFYQKRKTKQPALRDMLRHFHGLYCHRPKLSTNQRARIRSVIVKFAVVHPLDNKVRDFSFLKTGFSSYIRDPADKMRFFQAYTDITGLGKKMQKVIYRSVEGIS